MRYHKIDGIFREIDPEDQPRQAAALIAPDPRGWEYGATDYEKCGATCLDPAVAPPVRPDHSAVLAAALAKRKESAERARVQAMERLSRRKESAERARVQAMERLSRRKESAERARVQAMERLSRRKEEIAAEQRRLADAAEIAAERERGRERARWNYARDLTKQRDLWQAAEARIAKIRQKLTGQQCPKP